MRHRRRGRDAYQVWDYQDFLASRDDGLYFDVRLRFFGHPRPHEAARDEPGIAGADKIRADLETIARRYTVLRRHAARHALATTLLEMLPFTVPSAEFREATITVYARPEDLEAAQRIEHARHELELDNLAHRQIRARMAFLREECLRDPASAQIFTLLPPSPRLTETHPAADSDKLVDVVRKWEPTSGWVRAAKNLVAFGEKLTPDQLEALGRLGREIMERFSEAELGRQFAEALKQQARAEPRQPESPRT
ncbi:hypothetical protein [Amycolatopsis japonica]